MCDESLGSITSSCLNSLRHICASGRTCLMNSRNYVRTAISPYYLGTQTMKLLSTFTALGLIAFAQPAFAQLEVYKDYDVSDTVSSVTTVKVDSNMGDYYLEGLRGTWIESNELAKKLGHIEDYAIYGSATPNNGEFNMILVVNYKNMGDTGPSKAKYDAFMKEWGSQREKKTRAVSKTYPDIRTITGEYLMHKITVK